MIVRNAAGEAVFCGKSDAECVRWWREEGLSGDWLADTGELMSHVDLVLELADD